MAELDCLATASSCENFWQSLLFLAVVVCLGLATLVNCYFHQQPDEISAVENRYLNPLPDSSLLRKNFSSFLSEGEKFYNDRFPMRLDLQRIRSLILYSALSTSSSSTVVLGKNHRLFYYSENLCANDLFNATQLKNWTQLLENRRDILAEHGIKYMLAVVPEKSTVSPEYLPDSLLEPNKASRYKQLQQYLQVHSNICEVDLLTPLTAAKNSQSLYYQSDSHWTNYGALIGAMAITRQLENFFSKVSSKPLQQMVFTRKELSGDLAKMLNLEGIINETTMDLQTGNLKAVPATPIESFHEFHSKSTFETLNPDRSLPSAFILHDSFSLALQPYLSEVLGAVRYHRYQALPIREIIELHPDVVIQEFAERHLYNLGANDGFALGTYPFYPVEQKVSSDKTAQPQEISATYASGISIRSLKSIRNGRNITLEINWVINEPGIPTDIVGIHALDAEGHMVGGADYCENPSYLEFKTGDRLQDRLSITLPEKNSQCSKIGVVMYQEKNKLTPVKAIHCDWSGSRALFSI